MISVIRLGAVLPLRQTPKTVRNLFTVSPKFFFITPATVFLSAILTLLSMKDSKVNHSDRAEWKEILQNSGTTWVFEGTFEKGDSVISAYNKQRGGFKVEVTADGTLCCFAAGESANFTVESSINVCDGKKHHIAWIMDTAACISYLVIDGIFDNGGNVSECGWRFIPHQLSFIRAVKDVSFGENISDVRLIPNAILTADAIGDWRASL